MKAKREHRVPLCERALEILEAARTLGDGKSLVFPMRSVKREQILDARRGDLTGGILSTEFSTTHFILNVGRIVKLSWHDRTLVPWNSTSTHILRHDPEQAIQFWRVALKQAHWTEPTEVQQVLSRKMPLDALADAMYFEPLPGFRIVPRFISCVIKEIRKKRPGKLVGRRCHRVGIQPESVYLAQHFRQFTE